MDRSDARRKYAAQKANSARRGIDWEFTFDEWCAIWEPRWAERGPHKGQLVMCRTHDRGPYRADNVRLDTPKSNAAEAGLMQRCGRTYMHLPNPHARAISGRGFDSYGSTFPRPDQALEAKQEEYEWIPGE